MFLANLMAHIDTPQIVLLVVGSSQASDHSHMWNQKHTASKEYPMSMECEGKQVFEPLNHGTGKQRGVT